MNNTNKGIKLQKLCSKCLVKTKLLIDDYFELF